jgi:hypothetical protein
MFGTDVPIYVAMPMYAQSIKLCIVYVKLVFTRKAAAKE